MFFNTSYVKQSTNPLSVNSFMNTSKTNLKIMRTSQLPSDGYVSWGLSLVSSMRLHGTNTIWVDEIKVVKS